MSDDKVLSHYWNWMGSFTKGPQPCGCGGPSDCPKREEHIPQAIKKLAQKQEEEQLRYRQQQREAAGIKNLLIHSGAALTKVRMTDLEFVTMLLFTIPSGIENQDDLNLVKGIGVRLFKSLNAFLWKNGAGVNQDEFDSDVNSLTILHSNVPDKFNVVRKQGASDAG